MPRHRASAGRLTIGPDRGRPSWTPTTSSRGHARRDSPAVPTPVSFAAQRSPVRRANAQQPWRHMSLAVNASRKPDPALSGLVVAFRSASRSGVSGTPLDVSVARGTCPPDAAAPAQFRNARAPSAPVGAHARALDPCALSAPSESPPRVLETTLGWRSWRANGGYVLEEAGSRRTVPVCAGGVELPQTTSRGRTRRTREARVPSSEVTIAAGLVEVGFVAGSAFDLHETSSSGTLASCPTPVSRRPAIPNRDPLPDARQGKPGSDHAAVIAPSTSDESSPDGFDVGDQTLFAIVKRSCRLPLLPRRSIASTSSW